MTTFKSLLLMILGTTAVTWNVFAVEPEDLRFGERGDCSMRGQMLTNLRDVYHEACAGGDVVYCDHEKRILKELDAKSMVLRDCPMKAEPQMKADANKMDIARDIKN